MIEFAWPWLFLLLPLPWLVRRLLPPIAGQQQAALRVPLFDRFSQLEVTGVSSGRRAKLTLMLGLLAWALLLAAAARPNWVGEPIELPVSGRDLMLAVDLSGSMEVEDFVINGQAINRLVATKIVAGEFIERRVGDRLGLILFGRNAYVQTPLTFDRKTVRSLLEESAIGLAGKETAIGDAIGLAVKRLRDRTTSKAAEGNAIDTTTPEKNILILLTDGANTAGEVEPLKAAELAAAAGLTIYTIGIGADEMMVRSLFGTQRVNPSRDLDEGTLTAIARATGGRYFRARDIEGLNQIYGLIDELEPIARESRTFRPQRTLFFWPLAAALLLAGLVALLWRRQS
jgi:Ca-activated chloride channel family protein